MKGCIFWTLAKKLIVSESIRQVSKCQDFEWSWSSNVLQNCQKVTNCYYRLKDDMIWCFQQNHHIISYHLSRIIKRLNHIPIPKKVIWYHDIRSFVSYHGQLCRKLFQMALYYSILDYIMNYCIKNNNEMLPDLLVFRYATKA